MNEPSDALVEALEAFERWQSEGARDAAGFLQRHAELKSWLEPLVRDAEVGARPSCMVDGREAAEGVTNATADELLRRVRSRHVREGEEGDPGRYEVGEEIARGGMGAILSTFDRDLRRTLAMKVAFGEATASGTPRSGSQAIDRFLAEAQVTGQLDHPGVVPVHDIGIDDAGRVYFTMRLVKGHDLGEVFARLREGAGDWSLTRVVGVVQKVCDTLAYAHSKGVIHRDVKPRNVMIGRFGEVYLMDWGLARVSGEVEPDPTPTSAVLTHRQRNDDSPFLTKAGDIVGTPAYMAPEQARGDLEELGPAVDVYAVGAMLYELLAGHPPYLAASDDRTPQRILERVRLGAIVPVERAAPTAPGALLAICRRAMARDPRDRYVDVGALGVDLRAYLEGRVVRAYRTGAWTELWAWMRRNRGLAIVASLLVVTLVIGLVTTLLLASVAQETAIRERSSRELAEGLRLCAQSLSVREDSPTLALQLAIAGAEQVPSHLQANRALYRAIERQVEVAVLRGHEDAVDLLAVSPDGRWVTTSDLTGLQILWDATARRLVHRWDEHEVVTRYEDPALGAGRTRRGINAIGFSPDSKLAFSAGSDGTVRVWDVISGARQRLLKLKSPVTSGVFATPTEIYVGSADGVVRRFDVVTGGVRDEVRHDAAVLGVLAAGQTLVSYGLDDVLIARGRAAGAPAHHLPLIPESVPREDRIAVADRGPGKRPKVSISRDGTLVMAVCCKHISFWRTVSGERLALPVARGPNGHLSADGRWAFFGAAADRRSRRAYDFQKDRLVRFPADGAAGVFPRFSPDGRRLMLRTEIWDLTTGRLVTNLSGHDLRVFNGAWLDDDRLVTAGEDRTVRLWSLARTPRRSALRGHRVAVAPGGKVGIALSPTHVVPAVDTQAPPGLVDLETGEVVDPLDGGDPPNRADFDSSGRFLALPRKRRLVVYDLHARRAAMALDTLGAGTLTNFSNDGRMVVVDGAVRRRRIRLFDLTTTELLPVSAKFPRRQARQAAFTVDGARLVVANSNENVATVWSTRTGELLHTFYEPHSMAVEVACSPDGRKIAVSCIGSLYVYDAANYRLLTAVERLRAGGRLQWSPDSRLLTFTVKGCTLLDAGTGTVLMDWPDHRPGWPRATQFSPTGDALLAATRPGVIDELPLDPLARARSLQSRPIDAQDMEQFGIGQPHERRDRRRALLVESGTTLGLTQAARLALDDGHVAAAFELLARAAKARPRGPIVPEYFAVRAQALCRSIATEDSVGGKLQSRTDRLAAAFESLRQAVTCGMERKEVGSLPDIEPLRVLPDFVDWLSLR